MEPQGPLNPLDPRLGWINAPVHIHELRGHPTLYVFFNRHAAHSKASWRELIMALATRVARGLSVVGIHVPIVAEDLDSQVIERFVQDVGIPYPVAVDTGRDRDSIAVAHDISELPSFLMFDRHGELQEAVVRPEASEELMEALDLWLDDTLGPEEQPVLH